MFWLSVYQHLLRIYCGPGTVLNAALLFASLFILTINRDSKYPLSRLLGDSVKPLSSKGYSNMCHASVHFNHFWRVIFKH